MAGETLTVTGHEFRVKKGVPTHDQAIVNLLSGMTFITTRYGLMHLIRFTRRGQSASVTLGRTTPPRAEVIQRSR